MDNPKVSAFVFYAVEVDIDEDMSLSVSNEFLMQSILSAGASGEYDVRDASLLFRAMKFFELIAEGVVDHDGAKDLAAGGVYLLQKFAYGELFAPSNYAEIIFDADCSMNGALIRGSDADH